MGAGDAFDRMEQAARGESRRFVPLRQRFVEVVILVSMIFILGYLLYAAQFSGGVRWFLGCSLIAVLALYAWYTVSRSTAEPAPLSARRAAARPRYGDLATLTGVVHRANQGLPYSQVAVSSRAREAFEEQVRLARGLTPEGMHALERDPVGLQAAFHDAVLEEFVHLDSTEPDERYRWVWAARAAGGFEGAFGRILDRMEGWR
jgi:hypothetical protein